MNPVLILLVSMTFWGYFFILYILACLFTLYTTNTTKKPLPLWAYPGKYLLYFGCAVFLFAMLGVLLYPFYYFIGG